MEAAGKLNYRFVVGESGINRIEQDWILRFAQKLIIGAAENLNYRFCGRGKVEPISLQSGIILNETEY